MTTATAVHPPQEGRRPPVTWTWLAHPDDPTPDRKPTWDGHATRVGVVPPWLRVGVRR